MTTQDVSSSLTLANIRDALIRQEDTIIFNFIERAQFAKNDPVYQSDAIPVPGFHADGRRYSLLEYVIRETEKLHGGVRRYTSPDEHAFYPDDLPALVLPPIQYPNVLHPCANGININSTIMDVYINSILSGIAAPGDDGNYGSAATLDVLVLQALSKRIHYGKFVAEAKFRSNEHEYEQLIRDQDSAGLMAALTFESVEQRVVERVRLKAATFGQDISSADQQLGQSVRFKVLPDVVAQVYQDYVMPLTKEVQVAYLLRRLD